MLTYGGLKQHVQLALGGQPSVVTGVTPAQRIAEIVNQAGSYLFSKPWRFRERTARPVSLTANQNWAPLPGDAEEIVSLVCKAGLGWRVELTSPEQIEILRTSAEPGLIDGAFYAAMSRPWAQANGSPLADGSGMPDVRLDLYPTPQTTTADAIIIRYRAKWVAISDATSADYQIPVPAYAEALLIAYARAFGLAYEDEGLSARLIEIDNGPLYNTVAIKDGIQQRDYGRLLPNRVSPFRRESDALSLGLGIAAGGVILPATAASNIRWRGVWNANDSYVVGDVVRSGNSVFIAVTANSNVAPPASQWELMVLDGTSGTGLSDGDRGDITVSGSGATFTIDNAAVTYAKIQDVTGTRLLGRGVTSVGSVQEITVGNGLKLQSGMIVANGISDPNAALVDTLRTISAGTGLTGGGDLSTDRTFTVDFAASGVSSSTKAVRADDSRLSDARTPTAHTHSISDVTNLQTTLDGKAASSHTHAISDVTNLQTTLDGKAAASHTHAAGDITSGTLNIARIPTGTTSSTVCIGNDSRLSDARTPLAHTHAISDVTNLQTSLDGKAASVHTHAISDVTGLQTALDGKAATSHVHSAADVTTGTLDIARIPTGSTSTTVCIGNDARLSDARTPLAHVHAASDVTSGTFNIARIPTGTTSSTVCIGDDSRLSDARTPLAHTHVISDVTNLQTTLDGKAASSHTHVATDISNSTSVGRNVLTAADAAAARSAISVPTIYSGTTTPSSGLGADGDLYFKY